MLKENKSADVICFPETLVNIVKVHAVTMTCNTMASLS